MSIVIKTKNLDIVGKKQFTFYPIYVKIYVDKF